MTAIRIANNLNKNRKSLLKNITADHHLLILRQYFFI